MGNVVTALLFTFRQILEGYEQNRFKGKCGLHDLKCKQVQKWKTLTSSSDIGNVLQTFQPLDETGSSDMNSSFPLLWTSKM